MAELDWPTADNAPADDPSPAIEAEAGAEQAIETSGETTPPVAAQEDDSFFDPNELSDELKAQWKKMQGAFTKARQRDRAAATAAKEKADFVDRLNSDAAFARSVVEHLAPRLGVTLPQPTQQAQASPVVPDGIMQALQEELGTDLAFLAPALAKALTKAANQAVSPYEQRAREREQGEQVRAMQARRAEEERIRAELDSEVPDWEAKYGDQLQALQAFLASDALTHATFGTKQGLLLRLLDPSISRRDILREMKDKPRQGVRTGRSGQPTRSNLGDKLRETHREKGWGEMWNLIQSNPDAILNEFRE